MGRDDVGGGLVDLVKGGLERVGFCKKILQEQGRIHIQIFTSMGFQGGAEGSTLGVMHLIGRYDADGTRAHRVNTVFNHQDPFFVTVDEFHTVMKMEPGNDIRFRWKFKIIPKKGSNRKIRIQLVFPKNVLFYLVKSLFHNILLSANVKKSVGYGYSSHYSINNDKKKGNFLCETIGSKK